MINSNELCVANYLPHWEKFELQRKAEFSLLEPVRTHFVGVTPHRVTPWAPINFFHKIDPH